MSALGAGGRRSLGAPEPISQNWVMVREASADDYEEVGALTVEAFRGVPGSTLSDSYAAELADVGSRARAATVLVAVVGAAVAGSVAYVGDVSSPLGEWLGPGEAGLRMLAVAPRAQGAGIGAALVGACVERARAQGCSSVALYSTEQMRSAHRLYLRAGFRRVPSRDHQQPGLRLLCFVRELD